MVTITETEEFTDPGLHVVEAPGGTIRATFKCWGAAAGDRNGGFIEATVTAEPGDVFEVNVGGAGTVGEGGVNGGGGTDAGDDAKGKGGGGGSDVRDGSDFDDRLLAAGGAGGDAGAAADWDDAGNGGEGGAAEGEDGTDALMEDGTADVEAEGGGGGTQVAGGDGGTAVQGDDLQDGGDGAQGVGGGGASSTADGEAFGGGGGGGWFGGGGGAAATDRAKGDDNAAAGGGAGGSNGVDEDHEDWESTGDDLRGADAENDGDGKVVIEWEVESFEITGTVDIAGSPVEAAVVYVTEVDPDVPVSTVQARVTTDAQGDYSADVPIGRTYHVAGQFENEDQYRGESLPFIEEAE